VLFLVASQNIRNSTSCTEQSVRPHDQVLRHPTSIDRDVACDGASETVASRQPRSCCGCWDVQGPRAENKLLRRKGFQPLAAAISTSTKGHHNQSVRYLEPLLYQSQQIFRHALAAAGRESEQQRQTLRADGARSRHSCSTNLVMRNASHDAPWMPTIGERVKRGSGDPVIPTVCLSRIPSSSTHQDCGTAVHFSRASATHHGMVVVNLVRIWQPVSGMCRQSRASSRDVSWGITMLAT
jgi:hypothetical protein